MFSRKYDLYLLKLGNSLCEFLIPLLFELLNGILIILIDFSLQPLLFIFFGRLSFFPFLFMNF